MRIRLFKNSFVAASITGLDETVIKDFQVSLQVLSTGYQTNIPNFEAYVSQIKHIYLNLYTWYKMTPTVHKILEDSSLIIQHHLDLLVNELKRFRKLKKRTSEDLENITLEENPELSIN